MIDKNKLFEDLGLLPEAKVLCIGDLMLDRFVYGSIERISPEAPIPVLLVEAEKNMLGGAGNVAANLASLGATATLAAVVGDDGAGKDVAHLLTQGKITPLLEIAADRGTTVKSRFVCGAQQMLRVDREKSHTIPTALEAKLLKQIENALPTVGCVILSDYKKGLLSDTLIQSVIKLAKKYKIPVVVDPKGTDFTRYQGATVITPNRKELEVATNMKADSAEAVTAAARKIIATCHVDAVLATRSKDGMSVISATAPELHIPANVREVYDVSGAGDTVIATFAAGLAVGLSFEHAAYLANIAAGIVVGKAGTATTRIDEIHAVLSAGHHETKRPVSIPQAVEIIDRLRIKTKKIGFTNGVFDLLHPGHLTSLRQAKSHCDFLVVAINSDASVKRLKGPTRPIQTAEARAEILTALDIVDMVLIFDTDTPLDLIKAIKPDALIKGGQYKLEEVVGYDVVMAYGGKIIRADMAEGFSTTNTIAKMAG